VLFIWVVGTTEQYRLLVGWLASDQGFLNLVLHRSNISLEMMADRNDTVMHNKKRYYFVLKKTQNNSSHMLYILNSKFYWHFMSL